MSTEVPDAALPPGQPSVPPGERWVDHAGHRCWLFDQATALLDFFYPAGVDAAGGFHPLDVSGRARDVAVRDLVQTARMVHCFSLAHLLGRPAAAGAVDHALNFLERGLHDTVHGGWFWLNADGSPIAESKQAYGHAFVLLAASSALQAGFTPARELLDDVTAVLEERFWDAGHGLYREEFARDWQPISSYRGGNSNMHLTEALLAAFDATGDRLYLDRARSVAERLINQLTPANRWRLAEHYTEAWVIDAEYNRSDPRNTYRPFGSVVGHSPEWARLLLCLNAADPGCDWYVDAAKTLFDVSVPLVWDAERSGLPYTVDFDGAIIDDDHYQWPVSEAIGACVLLAAATGDERYEAWYRALWRFVDEHLIDRENGGWHYVLDADNRPKEIVGAAEGKPDLYHALQSCLVPLLPPFTSLATGLRIRFAEGA